MRIMEVFPKKLPSRIKKHAQSLEILSEFESAKIHDEFCWPCALSFPVKVMVVLFVNGMMCCFAFSEACCYARAGRASEHIFSFVINYIIENEF